MGHFSSLNVWHKARTLSTNVVDLMAEASPLTRRTLENQMTRAADSVVFNIAESTGKDSLRDQIRILVIARGSAYELEAQFYSVSDREAGLTNKCEQLRLDACEVQRMI